MPLVDTFGKDLFPGEAHERVLAMTSQLIGITVAAAAGGDEKAQEKAGWVAQQATLYNHELHRKNAESFAQGVQMACVQRPGLCAPGAEGISQSDLVHALEVTAAHGEGIETVNPKALALVNQFLNGFSGTKETLFSPTESEQHRLDVLETAELAGAAVGLASAAKTVLKSSGGLLEALKGFLGSGGAKGSLPEIKVIDGFYQAEGTPFKFSEYYYNRLWSTGRGAPFVQADEVLKTATSVTPDRKNGFFRYTNEAMEMIYNPATKEVWHLQPLR